MIGARTIGSLSDRRENNFNLLRMIAAIGVLVSHSYPLSLGNDAVQPLASSLHGTTLGTVCVWIFFAISGFFITQSFLRNPSPRRFLVARALRLFPGLLVVLVLTVVVSASVLTEANPIEVWRAAPDYLLYNLTLFKLVYELPGVFESNPYGAAINGSLWTLSYEVICYMGVLLAGVLGLLHRPRLFWPLMATLLAVLIVLRHLELHERIYLLATMAFPFALGSAAYIGRAWVALSSWLAIGLAGVAAVLYSTPAFLPAFVLMLTYGIFVIGYWQSPWLQKYNRLGDYSYGMYIYAFPVQQIVAWRGITDPLINIAISAPVTLGCAVLSWHLVEKPALGFKPSNRARAQSLELDG